MSNHTTPVLRTLLLGITLTIISLTATAHKGATGVVKQRMDSMSEMGDAMGTMADMVKGKRAFDAEEVRASTLVLEHHAKRLLDYFPDTPESRNGKETEALPLIWESWDQFTKLSNDMLEEIVSFKEVVDNGLDVQTLKKEFRKHAKACSACHDDFRKPKD